MSRSGTITWLDRREGYGLIRLDDNNIEIIFHCSELDGECRPGQRVRVHIRRPTPQAARIELLSTGQPS